MRASTNQSTQKFGNCFKKKQGKKGKHKFDASQSDHRKFGNKKIRYENEK